MEALNWYEWSYHCVLYESDLKVIRFQVKHPIRLASYLMHTHLSPFILDVIVSEAPHLHWRVFIVYQQMVNRLGIRCHETFQKETNSKLESTCIKVPIY